LWAIPDAPTADLMVAFYQQLAQHGDKAQALREAMLATQESYPHPMNWAAFTLVGSAL
ncbi:MAG: CHAT domain-containing protein, partial [Spirulina sp. SIO3F2]|nr:CHAT domain-containing protein [Spirulina sp. SIO3F2]